MEWKQNNLNTNYDVEKVQSFIYEKLHEVYHRMTSYADKNNLSYREASYVLALTNLENMYKVCY